MTNTVLLEQYIEKSGYKKSYIAKRLGITPYSLALKINNKSEFKGSEMETLWQLLDIAPKERMSIFFAK